MSQPPSAAASAFAAGLFGAAGAGLGAGGLGGRFLGFRLWHILLQQLIRHGLDAPQLVFAKHILPDLGLGTVIDPHAYQVNDLISQHIADLGLAAIGGNNLPPLALAGGFLPLVHPGSVHNTTHGQVHHLAGKAVFDAVLAFGGFLKNPLLPGLTLIAPQADGCAVLGVEIGNFQHAAIGGSDSIAGAFPNDGLCGFFHSVFPPLPVRRFWCLTGYVFIVHIIAHSHKAVLPKSCKVFW